MGMLSAGQRNAVLLAPLLAVAGGGPFRFLVLDDPVHAFDSVRVDRLADAIERLAVGQRVIVLTHDERFYEHLMAANVPVDSHFVSRSPATQTVTVEPRHEMWDTLLGDAEILMQQAGRELKEMPLGLTATVRGLCRQALDHGIRTMVLRHERHTGGDTQAALDQLDGALTTRERLKIGEERVQGSSEFSNRVHEAKSRVGPFLGRWNEASHSPQNVKDVATKAEVAAARRDQATARERRRRPCPRCGR
jgi:ABC-type sulfate/molybdate transport systems ATPase subunit